jgi:hypothetical protein
MGYTKAKRPWRWPRFPIYHQPTNFAPNNQQQQSFLGYCAHITRAIWHNIPSGLSNIQIKAVVTFCLISESDRLPYHLTSDSSFTFLIELLGGTWNQRGQKSARWNIRIQKYNGRVVAGILWQLAVKRIMKWGQSGRHTMSMSKSCKFLLWWYIHIWLNKAWHSHYLMNATKRRRKKEMEIWGVYNSYRRKKIQKKMYIWLVVSTMHPW